MRDDTPWVLYTGATSVYRSSDAGDEWEDLSTVVSGGVWSNDVVAAIAVTTADPQLMMVAKGDAVYTSRDGGQTWRVTVMASNVNNIGISDLDPDMALACLAQTSTGDGQLMRTTDGGSSWHASASGLPPFAVQVARWDPVNQDVAYAGTDVGLYRSTDRGLSWAEVGDGLPAASIHDLRINADGSRLVAATHGRGVWELNFEVPVNTPPTVVISTPGDGATAVLGTDLDFAAAAEDVDGDQVTMTWIFGDYWQTEDGGSSVGAVTSTVGYTFDRGGRYLVAAHAADDRGGTAVDTLEVVAYEPADDCATPRVIPGDGPFPVTVVSENFSATTADTDPDVACVYDPAHPDRGRYGSVWFELVPAASATYVISTCGSKADTVLSAWTGPRCGPYTAITDGCNDDDDLEHCTGARTDSYLELDLEAGSTYRFMVGSWGSSWQGRFRFNVECLECPGASPGRLYLVPAAAHSDGLNQTIWQTDLSLFNPGQTAVTAHLDFQPASSGSAGDMVEVIIPTGTAQDFEDVVAGLLGAWGSGAIQILATDELLITSRTYNTAASGTFGQGIAGGARESAVAPGGAARLIGLAGNTEFRTNIGLASIADVATTVTVELNDEDGVELATRDEVLPAHGWRQLNRIFDLEHLGEVDSAYAVVRNTSTEGHLFAYASVVDERTGDPTYVTATEVAGEGTALWVPAAAHTAGVGTSVWRTDLVLANVGDHDLTATIEFFPSRTDNRDHPQVTHRVAAGMTETLDDVLFSLFDFTGTGALRITVNRSLLMATSRTYTVGSDGSYGQFIPGITEQSAIDDEATAALLQLRADANFRTNVGMVNLTGLYVGVSIRYFDASGGRVGARDYTLLPHSHRQVNGAVPGGNTPNGFALVSATTAGGRLLAYASVVDNGSDDPVYIPAVVFD
jgi:hypothetical protein